MTLEQILEIENKKRVTGGIFGITECKKSIMIEVKYFGRSLYMLLEEYVHRANNDPFFNRRMVLACWELINNR